MSPDDLTAATLSALLGANVRSVTSRPIGDGLVGMNLRLKLDVVDGQTPPTIVAKLPSVDPTSRATGVALRNYEREVKFYRELASTVDIRVPRCHHAEWDETDGDFVILLEDMAPAEQGDQITGCSPDLAAVTVAELARLHGPRWGDPELDTIEWLSRRTPENVAHLEGLWAMFLPGFLGAYRPHLSDAQTALLQRFGRVLGGWIEGRTGPQTIIHGDFRLDNLLFGTDAGGPPVTAVDWQTPGQGIGVGDLSYFVGAGLLPEDRRTSESDLAVVYRSCLAEYGIDLDADELWRTYCREAFGGVIMAVVASQVVGESERSEAMFAAMASRHLQQALDLESIDLV